MSSVRPCEKPCVARLFAIAAPGIAEEQHLDFTLKLSPDKAITSPFCPPIKRLMERQPAMHPAKMGRTPDQGGDAARPNEPVQLE